MKQDLINGTNDEYYTHEYSIKPLLKYVKSGSTVWCPFDPPQSRFVTEFEKHGCTVIRTHIAENGNFFEIDTPECDYIISNPPYSCKAQVFKKLFETGKPFAMLIGARAAWWLDLHANDRGEQRRTVKAAIVRNPVSPAAFVSAHFWRSPPREVGDRR